ncbi:MAG: hypothetical protein LBS09_07780 [Bacteroidales bacterium]|jgi:hypothetical protein|nr:hypothetical protein [Bacteroidales bacterium]
MIIDTQKEASTLWRTKMLLIAVFISMILMIVFFISLSPELKKIILGGWSLLFLLFYWYQYRMEYTYFYFSGNGKNLIFRFYSMRNFYGKPKSIEIAKTNFYKYDVIFKFFNKKEMLVLYQKTPKGIAKYPPIPLTLLTKNQKTELKRTLFAASGGRDSGKTH